MEAHDVVTHRERDCLNLLLLEVSCLNRNHQATGDRMNIEAYVKYQGGVVYSGVRMCNQGKSTRETKVQGGTGPLSRGKQRQQVFPSVPAGGNQLGTTVAEVLLCRQVIMDSF